MKLKVVVIPYLIFLAFGYNMSVMHRAEKPLTLTTVSVVVKADLAKFTPSTQFVINK